MPLLGNVVISKKFLCTWIEATLPGVRRSVLRVPLVGDLLVGERSNFKKIPTHTQDHGDA